jgi:hypothetical protein
MSGSSVKVLVWQLLLKVLPASAVALMACLQNDSLAALVHATSHLAVVALLLLLLLLLTLQGQPALLSLPLLLQLLLLLVADTLRLLLLLPPSRTAHPGSAQTGQPHVIATPAVLLLLLKLPPLPLPHFHCC